MRFIKICNKKYDTLGRIIIIDEPEGKSQWVYDNNPSGVGKISSITDNNGFNKQQSYDNLGRLISSTTAINSINYTSTYQYDNNSRLIKETLPNGFVVENVYNEHGFLKAITSPKEQITDYNWQH